MKNKKGFTLVELLAVIIVLIIIMLIALNVIRTSTKKAKDNTVRANAISFIKAVDDMIDGSDNQYEYDGSVVFSIQDLYDKGLKMSGTQPDGGFLMVSNGEIIYGCLTYGKNHVNYESGDVTQPKKGACKGNVSEEYAYTGGEQVFSPAVDGMYLIQAWGAQGGDSLDTNVHGGYGAYSVGQAYLKKGDKLYINVGEKGVTVTSSQITSSYNGGGSCKTDSDPKTCGNGGGATSVSTSSGLLSSLSSNVSSVLVVAGGGGGASTHATDTTTNGGSAGGYIGSAGSSNTWGFGGGGTQTAGGAKATTDSSAQNGSFGLGGNGAPNAGAGGGGGFYGGGGGHGGSAGGGSSYTNSYRLYNGSTFCYNCTTINLPTLVTNSTQCYSEEPTENCAKTGNGYAKIIYVGDKNVNDDSIKYLYNYGNQFVETTGGWLTQNVQGNGRSEILPSALYIWASSSGSSESRVYTKNKIDYTGYTKVNIIYEIVSTYTTGTYGGLTFLSGSKDIWFSKRGVGMYYDSVDISSLSSEILYLRDWDVNIKILSVWLSKD